MTPILRGRNIDLRPVVEEDAAFILSLRLDPTLGRYLSPVSDDVAAQRAWIRAYLEREARDEEHYFIIASKGGESLGAVRVYNLTRDSFTWGSWVIKRGQSSTVAIESVLMVYDYGFGALGRTEARFEVRRQNTRILRFHRDFGAQERAQDEIQHHFTATREIVAAAWKRYGGLLEPTPGPAAGPERMVRT